MLEILTEGMSLAEAGRRYKIKDTVLSRWRQQFIERAPYWTRVNRKRVQRLMRPLGFVQPQKSRKRRTTDSNHPFRRYPNLVKGLAVDRPGQVWAADITCIQLGDASRG